jgi:undecaprenyl-diphosphatase
VRAAATCGGAFAVVAVVVWAGWDRLAAFDERWATRAHTFMLLHPWCETIARIATWTASGLVITVLTALAVVVCVVRGHRWLACWLVLCVAGSAVLNSLVKEVVGRTRPDSARLEPSAHGLAFPSGHTQAATVTYVAVVLVVGWATWQPTTRVRQVSCLAVVVLVAAVGVSRVLLGAHWPSDALGGWLLGSAWVTAATTALRRCQPSTSAR